MWLLTLHSKPFYLEAIRFTDCNCLPVSVFLYNLLGVQCKYNRNITARSRDHLLQADKNVFSATKSNYIINLFLCNSADLNVFKSFIIRASKLVAEPLPISGFNCWTMDNTLQTLISILFRCGRPFRYTLRFRLKTPVIFLDGCNAFSSEFIKKTLADWFCSETLLYASIYIISNILEIMNWSVHCYQNIPWFSKH